MSRRRLRGNKPVVSSTVSFNIPFDISSSLYVFCIYIYEQLTCLLNKPLVTFFKLSFALALSWLLLLLCLTLYTQSSRASTGQMFVEISSVIYTMSLRGNKSRCSMIRRWRDARRSDLCSYKPLDKQKHPSLCSLGITLLRAVV